MIPGTLSALVLAALAPGDGPVRGVARVPPGATPPIIDGDPADPVWEAGVLLGELRQVEPVAGAEPSEATEVRLLYDDAAFYLRIVCRDSDPAGIRATQRLRDARLNPDDRVEFLFDTFHDRRNAFWFQIGAGGSKGDALVTRNGSSFNKEWDGIWEGEARVTAEGWLAEVAIPFATLSFDPTHTEWGFNLKREIRRKSETARWASPTPAHSFYSVAHAGTLQGLEGLQQGLGLDVVPYAIADWSHDGDADRTVLRGDTGLDAYYRLTPRTRFSVSVNTDFAETEVDSRQVNLTRFPLFFPEKRDFFLEDSGAFEFGAMSRRGGATVLPYFSRRIGLDDDGDEVPLRVATKISSQTDDFSLGLLGVQTADHHDLDAQELFVGRYSQNLLEQSDVGLIWAHGDPAGDVRSDTYGVDLNLRTDSFRGDRNLRLDAFLMRSATEGVHDEDLAWRVGLAYPNDEVDLAAGVTSLEDRFDPRLGFARRRGRRYDGQFRWRPRPYTSIRQYRFHVNPTLYTDQGNRMETFQLDVQPLGMEWESGEELDLYLERETEILDADFEIQDGVVIPQDRYDETRYGLRAETSSKRLVELQLRAEAGGFYGGRRRDLSLGIDVRPGGLLELSWDVSHNEVDLPWGDFEVLIHRWRANLVFTPRLAWSNYLQYDNVSDTLGWNSRLWWILRPGREVYLVLNQGWDWRPGEVAPFATQLTAKVGYTFRF